MSNATEYLCGIVPGFCRVPGMGHKVAVSSYGTAIHLFSSEDLFQKLCRSHHTRMFHWHKGKMKSLPVILFSSLFHCTLWTGQDPSVAFETPVARPLIKHLALFKIKIMKAVPGHLFCLFKWSLYVYECSFRAFWHSDRRELPRPSYGCTMKLGACSCDVWSLMLALCQLISEKKVRENTNLVLKYSCNHSLYGTLCQYLSLSCVNWQHYCLILWWHQEIP